MYKEALKWLLQQGSCYARGNVNYLCHFVVITSKAITFDEIIYASLYEQTLINIPFSLMIFFKTLVIQEKNSPKIFTTRKNGITKNSFNKNSYLTTLS